MNTISQIKEALSFRDQETLMCRGIEIKELKIGGIRAVAKLKNRIDTSYVVFVRDGETWEFFPKENDDLNEAIERADRYVPCYIA